MSVVEPLPESEAEGKVAQTYGRIREMLGTETVPEPFLLYGRVAPFLQDFYMNFKKFVFNDGQIDARLKAMIGLLVSSYNSSEFWRSFFLDRLGALGVDRSQTAEILAIGGTNAMYNTFFKFRENSGSDLFEGLPVGLRAHTFAGTSLTQQEVELLNIVISNINGCRPCTSGHVAESKNLGLSNEQLQEAVQCAATMMAGIQFLKAAS